MYLIDSLILKTSLSPAESNLTSPHLKGAKLPASGEVWDYIFRDLITGWISNPLPKLGLRVIDIPLTIASGSKTLILIIKAKNTLSFIHPKAGF
jgi:hypothetical protein